MAKRTAVIDIGSNSVRMVIYERTSRFAFHLLHEAKSRVRISEHAYENKGELQDEAMQRAFDALSEFSLILQNYQVNKTLCVATSALRDAPNKQAFINRIRKELKISIKVISGEREAYLGGIAAANLLHLESGLGIDIGGGSTEIAYFEDRRVKQTYSLDLGTVRLKELYFDNRDIQGARNHILEEFRKLPDTLRHERIIGIGGTLRALAKMVMHKEEHGFEKLHGFCLDIQTHQDYFDALLAADEKGLRELGVKEARLDVIQPGLLIISLLIEHIHAKQIIASSVGVREGLFLSDLLRSHHDRFPSNYNPSIKSILDRFSVKNRASLYRYSARLFDLCAQYLKLEGQYRQLFLHSISLSQVGKEIDFYDAHKHAYYLLLNGLNYGFSPEETLLIASLVRYQRKSEFSVSHLQQYQNYLPAEQTCNALAFLMRLCLDIFADFDPSDSFEMRFQDGTLFLKLEHSYLIKEKTRDLFENGPIRLELI